MSLEQSVIELLNNIQKNYNIGNTLKTKTMTKTKTIAATTLVTTTTTATTKTSIRKMKIHIDFNKAYYKNHIYSYKETNKYFFIPINLFVSNFKFNIRFQGTVGNKHFFLFSFCVLFLFFSLMQMFNYSKILKSFCK